MGIRFPFLLNSLSTMEGYLMVIGSVPPNFFFFFLIYKFSLSWKPAFGRKKLGVVFGYISLNFVLARVPLFYFPYHRAIGTPHYMLYSPSPHFYCIDGEPKEGSLA